MNVHSTVLHCRETEKKHEQTKINKQINKFFCFLHLELGISRRVSYNSGSISLPKTQPHAANHTVDTFFFPLFPSVSISP